VLTAIGGLEYASGQYRQASASYSAAVIAAQEAAEGLYGVLTAAEPGHAMSATIAASQLSATLVAAHNNLGAAALMRGDGALALELFTRAGEQCRQGSATGGGSAATYLDVIAGNASKAQQALGIASSHAPVDSGRPKNQLATHARGPRLPVVSRPLTLSRRLDASMLAADAIYSIASPKDPNAGKKGGTKR
jgi:hypothetical protein